MRRFLIVFAFITWIYRLVVFLGIAAAVYYFFFKLLGIFLFIVEIIWFVFRPFWMEIKVWVERRGEIGLQRWMGLAGGTVDSAGRSGVSLGTQHWR